MAVIGLGCPKMLRGRRKTESSLVGLEKRNAPVFHGSAAILRRSLLSDSGAPNGPFTIFKTGSLSDLRNKNTSVSYWELKESAKQKGSSSDTNSSGEIREN
ncbi:hypothetical protein AB6A40_011527 [Gnathostoma spinigerum]|uniref:Uncharacterized protein n=1 Tax=Gnathostoma spinigerum TaxID=75299 RepID=A0ABD6EXX2_9BILA